MQVAMSYSDGYIARVTSALYEIRATLLPATVSMKRQRACANVINHLITVWEDVEDKSQPVTFEEATLTDVSRAIVAYNQVRNGIATLIVDASARLSQAPYKSMQVLLGLTNMMNDVGNQTSRIVARLAILAP
jgi:hypothetical protein